MCLLFACFVRSSNRNSQVELRRKQKRDDVSTALKCRRLSLPVTHCWAWNNTEVALINAANWKTIIVSLFVKLIISSNMQLTMRENKKRNDFRRNVQKHTVERCMSKPALAYLMTLKNVSTGVIQVLDPWSSCVFCPTRWRGKTCLDLVVIYHPAFKCAAYMCLLRKLLAQKLSLELNMCISL